MRTALHLCLVKPILFIPNHFPNLSRSLQILLASTQGLAIHPTLGLSSSDSCAVVALGSASQLKQLPRETGRTTAWVSLNQAAIYLLVSPIVFFSSSVMKVLQDIAAKALSYSLITIINHYIVMIISIKDSLEVSVKIKAPLDQALW